MEKKICLFQSSNLYRVLARCYVLCYTMSIRSFCELFLLSLQASDEESCPQRSLPRVDLVLFHSLVIYPYIYLYESIMNIIIVNLQCAHFPTL